MFNESKGIQGFFDRSALYTNVFDAVPYITHIY